MLIRLGEVEKRILWSLVRKRKKYSYGQERQQQYSTQEACFKILTNPTVVLLVARWDIINYNTGSLTRGFGKQYITFGWVVNFSWGKPKMTYFPEEKKIILLTHIFVQPVNYSGLSPSSHITRVVNYYKNIVSFFSNILSSIFVFTFKISF